MKMSAKKLLVISAIVLTFSAVQTAWALEIAVSGTIDRIGTSSIDVVTDGNVLYTFYHIPDTVLATLEEGDSVLISAYLVTFPNGTTKNIAFSITDGEVTYSWHPNEPKAGATDSTAATSECPNSNCPGCEPISNNYDYNYDYSHKYLAPGPHKK